MRVFRVVLLIIFSFGLVSCETLDSLSSGRKTDVSKSPSSKIWRGLGAKEEDPGKVFQLNLSSDPAGAEISFIKKGKEVSLGETPATIGFRFEKMRRSGTLGQLGIRTWQPVISSGDPGSVVELPTEWVFSTGPIILKYDGYESETVHYTWSVPKDFSKRDEDGLRTGYTKVQRSEEVIMRNPTKPSFFRTVTLFASPSPAKFYVLNRNGTKGPLIGTSEITSKVGFAVRRTEDGEEVKWLRWSSEKPKYWSHTGEGELRVNMIMERESFRPEVLKRHLILNANKSKAMKQRVELQFTTPSVPEAIFTLEVDSLPTKTAIYQLNDDDSLGKKVGETPVTLDIGMGQQSAYNTASKQYVHHDWVIWDEAGVLKKKTYADGSADFFLRCTLYREGFAPEYVNQKLFTLKPGADWPKARVLNIPLLTPEHAAARERAKLAQEQIKIPPPALPEKKPSIRDTRKSFIWKAPNEKSETETNKLKALRALPDPIRK